MRDVIDGQIHLFATMGIESGLAAMDALGIQAAVIDEFWGYAEDDPRETQPCYRVAEDVYRSIAPQAELAAFLHPDRFSYILRVDPRDPLLDQEVRRVRDMPGGRGVRTEARFDDRRDALVRGEFDDLFAAADAHGLPIFVLIPDHAHLLEPLIATFPSLTVVVDHIGVPADEESFRSVLGLAQYPNVVVKWGHAPRLFGATEYPFPETVAPLRRAIEAYGADRLMWASDFTYPSGGTRWAEFLFSIRESPDLSEDEKGWLLGGTARRVLNWPAPAQLAVPPDPHSRQGVPAR